MIFIVLALFLANALGAQAPNAPDNRVLLDGIVTAVYGPMRTDIITYSDLQRPGIDGSVRTVPNLVDRILKDQEAQRYGMKSSPEAVDKQLQLVFRSNNWTEHDFNTMVQKIGWLPDEAREEFRIMSDVNQIEAFKIYQQLVVPEREIQAYYQDNPEYEEASHFISRLIIPYDFEQERSVQRMQLQERMQTDPDSFDWPTPFWLKDTDIAREKSFIRELPVGGISESHPILEGFEYIKMVDQKPQRIKPLEDVRNRIIETLKQPKVDQMQQAYNKELRAKAVIVHFDPDIREELAPSSAPE